MNRPGALALITLLVPLAAAAQDSSRVTRICIAPARAQTSGDNAQAVDAVRESFTSFLTGPTLAVLPLSARLESQARIEARQHDCPFLLFTELERKRKKKGGGLLGRMAGSAVQSGAWSAASGASSVVGRAAASAVAGAAGEAASNFASSVKVSDEIELSYRLESADRKVLVKKSEKRKAESDGEDLLTPLVEHAAERIANAVTTSSTGGAP
jgi:hypothetical protein